MEAPSQPSSEDPVVVMETSATSSAATEDSSLNQNLIVSPPEEGETGRAEEQPQQLVQQTYRSGIRGGWSTSICALFQDPSRRSDFCAITCCGVLLMDRNAYLLSLLHNDNDDEDDPEEGDLDENGLAIRSPGSHRRLPTRPNWKRRCFWIFAIPLAMNLLFAHWIGTQQQGNSDADKDDQDNYNNGSNKYIRHVAMLHRVVFWGYILFWMYQSRLHRSKLRQAIIVKKREMDDDQDTELSASLHESKDMKKATTMCCACYDKDDMIPTPHDGEIRSNANDPNSMETPTDSADMATCLWNALAAACCGACSCWCQLCGMCAIGQEDRELERLLLKQQEQQNPYSDNIRSIFQIDFITFQPFCEYYTKILEVRNRRVPTDWSAHLGALSELSQHMLKWFAGGLLGLALLAVAMEQVTSFWISIVGSTAQALIVLYLVHWRWGRFDLSLDAVIKYTAAGFVLAVVMSIVVEQLLMLVLSPLAIIMVILDVATVDTDGVPLEEWLQDPTHVQELLQSHLGQAALLAFVFSFVVAALTEELMKYMVYWITETPDLLTLNELGLSTPEYSNDDSKIRRARATTIAMVAVATGFAWSENIGYIHRQASSSSSSSAAIWNELAVLILRSIMPVHELCAAIQSIGIVRRDIEQDKTWKLGRSLFPAIFLHGFYDFVAIFGGVLEATWSSTDDSDDDDGDSSNSQGESVSVLYLLKSVAMLAPIVLLGAWYYKVQAKRQRQRLESLEGYTEIRGTTTTLDVIIEEQPQVEGSGEGLDAPLLEDADGLS